MEFYAKTELAEGRNQWIRRYAQTLNENCPDFYTM